MVPTSMPTHVQGESAKTKRQAIAIWATNPGYTPQELADTCNVSVRTVQRWRHEPEFVNELVRLSRAELHAHLPAIYHVAVEKALAGDYRCIKIVLDHVQALEEMQAHVNAEHTFIVSWKGTGYERTIG